MTSLVDQLTNSIKYAIHKATYDPEAEAYAKKKADAEAAEKAAAEKAATEAKNEQEKKEAAEKLAAIKAKEEHERKERERFDPWRLAKRIMATLSSIIVAFLVFMLATLGSSMATNLNLYKDTPYRILYAVYGFLFFMIVIPYVLGYRWWWKEKRPKFYALIPIIPLRFENRYAAMLLSWLSYKPDCQIESLKEWLEEQAEHNASK
jgi:hypothetical protein